MAISPASDVQIPVIDLSGDGEQVGDELIAAFRKWGFVFVRGEALGFEKQAIETTFDLVKI